MSSRIGAAVTWMLSDRNVRFLWIGRSGTFLADQVAELALIWFTWDITHSSVLVAMVAFLVRAPFWALGWFAGIYVDRVSRQRLITSTNLVGAGLAIAIPVTYAMDAINFAALSVLALMLAISRVIELPAMNAQLPELVEPSRVGALNLVMDNTKRIGRMIGPLVSSLLHTVLATPFLYFLVATGLMTMSYCSTRMRITRPSHNSKVSNVRADLATGWRVLQNDRPLFLAILCFGLYNPVYAIGYWIVLPRFFNMDLSRAGDFYGWAVTAFSIGAFCGNVVISALGRFPRFRGMLAGFVVVGGGFGALAMTANVGTAAIAIGLAAIGIPMMEIGIGSLINERVPKEHQGKLFALYRYFAELGLAVGLLAGGFVVDRLGARTSLAMLVAYVVPLVIAFHLLVQRAQRNEERMVAAVGTSEI